uniref:Uncharacterized protein n=1 Tax=Ciona savignyi TaxID=51511 RepID=H2YEQ9_CIOSA
QVHKTDISVFINGVESDMTPFATTVLQSRMADINDQPLIRVGQRYRATGQYVGRMQDFRWYDRALTNNEIVEIATGMFPEVDIQPNCLCPEGFPRVHPLEPRYCIPNGVPDTSPLRRLRVDPDAHPLAYINDDDSSTTWISSLGIYMPGGLTVNIDLENGEYQIFYIVLQFYSPQPRGITISRFSNGTDGDMQLWGHFADDCRIRFRYENNQPLNSPTDVNCIQFPPEHEIPYQRSNITFNLLPQEPHPRPGYNDFYGTPDLMQFVLASKVVQIRFQYQYFTTPAYVNIKHQYYGMDGIKVVGRCNCNGHAESCNTTVNPYQCNCLEYSNTDGYQENVEGMFCDKCENGFWGLSASGCQTCGCDSAGTEPGTTCDKETGQCVCKAHTQGRTCNECTDEYYNLTPTNPQGCETCSCDHRGTTNGSLLSPNELVCDSNSGQCACLPSREGRSCNQCSPGLTGRRCDECAASYWSFHPLFGKCETCNCHVPGSISAECNPVTGQCPCKDNVIYSCGPTISHFLAKGFKPYTSHNITMKLCNSVSCVFGDPSRVTTLPAGNGVLFWFRTYEPDCLLFLAASPLSSGGIRQEYLVIHLKDGRPWFLFDAQ